MIDWLTTKIARPCLAIASVQTMVVDKQRLLAPARPLTKLRHALSDEHYAVIEPLLPTNDRPVHPWKCHCSVINGILGVLHTGAQWRDLPRPTYGPWQTVYERFNRGSKDGTWGRPW